MLAAWRGHEADTVAMIEAGRIEATARGEGLGLSVSEWILALLFNGLGRYQDAHAAAERACADDVVANSAWALAELIEAGVRSGATDANPAALDRLSERTQASGTDWALGILARSRALLSEGDGADALYREAIERLERTRIRVELARARLLYGEWLRREQRRVDAREQLRAAHEMFSAMGAEGFAERARVELLATGETVRKRTVETRDELTAQEAQIARLARDGRTNPEIGAQLYISPRTVEWHLRNVFTKLGIRSRRELHEASPRGRCPRGYVPGGRPPGISPVLPGPGSTRGRRTGGSGTVVACPVSTRKEPPSCPPRSSSSTAPSPSPRAGTASSASWRTPVTTSSPPPTRCAASPPTPSRSPTSSARWTARSCSSATPTAAW